MSTRLTDRANHGPDSSRHDDFHADEPIWELTTDDSSLILTRKRCLAEAISKESAEECFTRAVTTIGVLTDIGGRRSGIGRPDNIETSPQGNIADPLSGLGPQHKTANP